MFGHVSRSKITEIVDAYIGVLGEEKTKIANRGNDRYIIEQIRKIIAK